MREAEEEGQRRREREEEQRRAKAAKAAELKAKIASEIERIRYPDLSCDDLHIYQFCFTCFHILI